MSVRKEDVVEFLKTLDHLDKIELFREAINPEPPKKIYNVYVNLTLSYRVPAIDHIEATKIIADEWESGVSYDLIDDVVNEIYAEEARVQND